jgi:hypothetical protein
MINWIKNNPVRAFTFAVFVLGLLATGAADKHLLSATVLAWLGLVVTVGTGAVGWLSVHNAVTPVANPKDANGEPLVAAITADPSVTS